MFGLPGLDGVVGRLQAGRLTVVAAPPNVGGSLLGLAAARRTALVDNHRVLYAASGPNRDDIFRRILAAETSGDYPRLKQGRLTPHEQQVAQQLGQAPLLIDDGSGLTAEAIADTAPHVDDLALVVVDRLQAARSSRLPLSGDRLPNASQVLAALARFVPVPVLAVVDSDDPTLLSLLDADVLLTLAATANPSKVQVTIAERDLGTVGSAYLQSDLLHARFLDEDTGAGGPPPALPPRHLRPAAERRLWNWPKLPSPTPPAGTRGSPPPSPTSWRPGVPPSPTMTSAASTRSCPSCSRPLQPHRSCRGLTKDAASPARYAPLLHPCPLAPSAAPARPL
nr:DnaB-like helicase C-terminal domain-containing protein [Streptomyces chartreusis]